MKEMNVLTPTHTVIENFVYRNRNFTIVADDEWYVSIEDKYTRQVGNKAILTQELGHADLHPGRTLQDCLDSVKRGCDIDYWMSIGMSQAEILAKVTGRTVEEVEQVLQEAEA